MGLLQNEWHRVFEEMYTSDELLVRLVRRAAESRGVSLSEEDVKRLAECLRSGGEHEATIPLADVTGSIVLTTQDLEEAFHAIEIDVEDEADRAICTALESLPPHVLRSLYEDLPAALDARREEEAGFRQRLHVRWGAGLNRLEMLITIAQESGGEHAKELSEEADLSAEDTSMANALIALHSRACRIASEVLCLLQCGHADGASARWRSLHEIAVTALFLSEHPGDTLQRYLDHAAVERLKSAKSYQEHCRTLGYDPLSTDEVEEIEKKADVVKQKYGSKFMQDYGWATEALAGKSPNFTNVEAALDMSHWRPYFKMACQAVHAGPQALNFSLCVPDDTPPALLAGASNAGLADPGRLASVSLMLASTALFSFHPTLDSLVVCKCMQQLCDDIHDAFMEAHDVLEDEIASEAGDCDQA